MFKEIGTLAEIGAKVGDVVECAQWIGAAFTPGEKYTVMNYACFQEGPDLECEGKWKLASSAQPTGPVITETVTRKRIVPGVYGKVSVGGDLAGSVRVRIGQAWFSGKGGEDLSHDLLSRADLIAARDVFNQLIDALEE